MTDAASSPAEVQATLTSRRFLALLLIAAVVGVGVSFAAWGFLELIHQINLWVFKDIPSDVGYAHGAPQWWSLPVTAIAGVIVAGAIVFLPGTGGHVPAYGLQPGAPQPIELPGILATALASIGLGLVIGPEAPLLALGGALGILTVRLARRDAPPQLELVIAATGSFAAMSMIFNSPLIAAVIIIEATGLGGARLPLVLIPGLLGAGLGSLISIGMGSWTGLSTSAYSLAPLDLPHFARPTIAEFGWVILIAAIGAIVAFIVFRLARELLTLVERWRLVVTPAAGLAVAGCAIAFSHATGKGQGEVLFSGQDALPSLVNGASKWTVSALGLVIAFKGLAWSLSLAGFRGGPTFPAIFIGAAGGILASHLPGFPLTPAVAVGLGIGVVSALRLPLSAVVLAILLTAKSGSGSAPLVIVGVIVAYLTTLALSRPRGDRPTPAAEPSPDGHARAEAGVTTRG